MDKFDKLQKIKMFDYPNCEYEDNKKLLCMYIEKFLSSGCTILQCVNGLYHYDIDHRMMENGMDKFAALLFGMLFMIEHDDVSEDQMYETYYDILDFETGEYDDLFTAKDLNLIKSDIKIIKDYISKFPELMNEVENDRKIAQSK